MNKRSKLLCVWIAVSAVILIAGIVLFALFGFNNALDKPASKTVDVTYNVVVELSDEYKNTLSDAGENAFSQNGVAYVEKLELTGQADPSNSSQSDFYENGNVFTVRYVFDSSVSTESLQTAAQSIRDAASGFASGADVDVMVHTLELQDMNASLWRAAVAVAVGAVVALIYVAVRFGIGSALTGLAAAFHDGLLTLAFFAVTRIPVYAFAPYLYAAVAMAASLVLWLVRCMKLRDNAKDPAFSALAAGEAVAEACKATDKTVLILSGTALVILAVCAVCMFSGGAAMLLACALVPVAAAMYSSMLFAPALHVHVKGAFDKLKAKRARYSGKKRAAREE